MTGYWYTSEQANWRCYFLLGETTPSFSDYKWNETICYWATEE